MSDVEHLVCSQCDDTIGVARIDSVAHLICHCTHVDGSIDPVKLEGPASMIRIPDEWYTVPEDAEEGGDE